MRIRTRTGIKVGPGAGTLTLVRNVYDPGLKRCREVYLGKVKGETAPSEVPAAITFARAPDGQCVSLKDTELARRAGARQGTPVVG